MEVYYESEYAVLGIYLLESNDLCVEGLVLIVEFDVLASDEPNERVL